jgi:thymidylate kinase
MPAIALIGADGAGKTTVTRMLERSGLGRFKYLYMGINTTSSNFALPSSRLADYLKSRAWTAPDAHGSSNVAQERPSGIRRTHVWKLGRLLNRIAEEWFRQTVACWYQARGYVVVYDRHFLFDFAPGMSAEEHSFDKRIHWWVLQRFFPRPDLVLFLDAPGHVLYARKGESTPTELERRREVILGQAENARHFVRIDATLPLSEVYEAVIREITRHISLYGPHQPELKRS